MVLKILLDFHIIQNLKQQVHKMNTLIITHLMLGMKKA